MPEKQQAVGFKVGDIVRWRNPSNAAHWFKLHGVRVPEIMRVFNITNICSVRVVPISEQINPIDERHIVRLGEGGGHWQPSNFVLDEFLMAVEKANGRD